MATDPVCGMVVEERATSLQLRRDNRTYYFCSESCLQQFSEPEAAQARLLRRIELAWPFAIAVVVLTYATPSLVGTAVAAGMAGVVQFYAGAPFYRGSRDAIVDRTWNMDLLISVGTTTAYVYSLAALLLPGRLPAQFYFDASSVIIAVILAGNYLEHRTRVRAGSALRRLAELVPTTAIVVRDGGTYEVPLAEIAVGDRLRVAPGGRFAADALVEAGRTSVDESVLTGEATPVAKSPGDRVLAGSVNGPGEVDVRVLRVGPDTFLAEVGRLLTAAEMSRVPLQRAADRLASFFVPAVLALGAIAAVLWFLLGAGGVTLSVLVFVTVVVTACPCAFGLATPAAILVGTGRAADAGILFRGEDAIEQAARVDLVLTDKTGTLTSSVLELSAVEGLPGVPPERALSLAAAVESGLSDPYARALRAAASARGLVLPAASNVSVEAGRGVRGTVDGALVEVVRAETGELAGPPASIGEALTRATARGEPASVVRLDGAPIGLVAFREEIGPGVREGLAALAAEGIPVGMVTGDRWDSARRVAERLGIREIHAEADPAQKLAVIRQRRADGAVVGYVGDGINDAPALAGADLGIALGSGTAVAREAGQVLLLRPDFRAVPLALGIARRTVAKVRSNLVWAVGYNAVLLPVAAGALVPIFGVSVYSVLPMAGAAAMGLSSSGVLLNSLSLRTAPIAERGSPRTPRATA